MARNLHVVSLPIRCSYGTPLTHVGVGYDGRQARRGSAESAARRIQHEHRMYTRTGLTTSTRTIPGTASHGLHRSVTRDYSNVHFMRLSCQLGITY